MLLTLPACETRRISTSDGRPLPAERQRAGATPASAVADQMMFFVGPKPRDTNGNGFPDLIEVKVSLFSHDHPLALRKDGTFVFELYGQGQFGAPEAKPITRWRLATDSSQVVHVRMWEGPAYLFALSLLDHGGDVLPLQRADLVCRFEPSDANAQNVQSDGVRSIQIGKRMAASGQ